MRKALKQQSLPWDEPSKDTLVDEKPIVQHLNHMDSVASTVPTQPEAITMQNIDEIMPYQGETSIALDITSPISQKDPDDVKIAGEKSDTAFAETGAGIQVPQPASEPEFNGAVEAANNATGTPVSSLEELAATLHNLACDGTTDPPAEAETTVEFTEPEAGYFVEPDEAAEFTEPEAGYCVKPGASVLAETETSEFPIPEAVDAEERTATEIAADFDGAVDPQQEQAPFVLKTSAAKVEKKPISSTKGENYSALISANADLAPETSGSAGDGRKSVGHKLRESRERLHLSVSEVAEATRIRSDYIIALEQHTINETPLAAVYVKSYIKSLCRHYDIRADALLAEYASALPQSKMPHAGLEQIDRDPPSTNGEERFSMAVKWSMVAIFAVITVLTLSFFVIDRNLDIATAPPESTLQPLQEKDLGRFMPTSEVPFRKLEVPEN